MLLTRRMLGAVARRARGEAGGALLAVIGVMAVLMIVGSVIAAMTISAAGFTTATRANVQSTAAAEAGVDYASAVLMAGACTTPTITNANPAFTADIYVSTATGPNPPSSWTTKSCPTANTTYVRVVSTGTAAAKGVAGQASGDTAKVEAVYAISQPPPSPTVNGPAVYAYRSSNFGAGGSFSSPKGLDTEIQIRHGDMGCSGGAGVTVDRVVVAEGALTLSGGCSVDGSVWASGKLDMSGGVKLTGTAVAGSIELSGGASVGGDAWAQSLLELSGGAAARGNVTVGTLDLRGGDVQGDAWVRGNASMSGNPTIHGDLTAKSKSGTGTVRGTVTLVPAGPGPGAPAPATPSVGEWVDFDYDPSDWAGFMAVKVGAGCDYDAVKSALASLGGRKGLLDARHCAPLKGSSWQAWNLPNDVAVFAKGFTLNAGGSITASGERKLWLITPDTRKDGKPTCESTPNVTLDGGFKIDPRISVLVYTPCKVPLGSGNEWSGQVYAGDVSMAGGAKLDYAPIGLPGMDLGGGGGGGGSPSTPVVTRLTVRDLSGS